MTPIEWLVARWGLVSAGLFTGLAWAATVMVRWGSLMDRNGWTGTDAPDWLFAVHVIGAVSGASLLVAGIYRGGVRGLDALVAGAAPRRGAASDAPRRMSRKERELRQFGYVMTDAQRLESERFDARLRGAMRSRSQRPTIIPGIALRLPIILYVIMAAVSLLAGARDAAALLAGAVVMHGVLGHLIDPLNR